MLLMYMLFLTGLAFSEPLDGSCSNTEWQCQDGSCISLRHKCDEVVHCADGSDERHCRKTRSVQNNCEFPQIPEHLKYSTNIENPEVNSAYPYINIKVTCDEGFAVVGHSEINCFNNSWWPSKEIPQCVPQCHLPQHPSVEYRCLLKGSGEGFRPCDEYELSGTEVVPKCREPIYYSPNDLTYMRCINGSWDYIAKCIPDCGTLTQAGTELIISGQSVKRGEVPWHAAIYTKKYIPYRQICGGSLISNTIVMSAAHCFWNNFEDEADSADKFAVAVGKIYRPWNDANDDPQKSDVKELHLPAHYQGGKANQQGDIAVVIVTSPFEFKTHVRPVCVDFHALFAEHQLQPGALGKVAGWGLTSANGPASQVLKVIDLPYVSVTTCIADSPLSFRAYITSDKICAGFKDGGKALCRGDSGGGLAFRGTDLKGKERFFLRGVVSTAFTENNTLCNANTYAVFTQLLVHEPFIKKYWVARDLRTQSKDYPQNNAPINGNCEVPPHPADGTYITDKMNTKPGDVHDHINIKITCNKGFGVVGSNQVTCVKGQWWPDQLPKCVPQCYLPQDRTVKYICLGSDNATSICDEYVLNGTVVIANCQNPITKANLTDMICQNGTWNYIAKCTPGTSMNLSTCYLDIRNTPDLQPLMLSRSLTWPTFEINDAKKMVIPRGKDFLLVCPKKFKNFPHFTAVVAACAGDTKFLINGIPYEYSDIQCTEAVKHVIHKSGEPCLPKKSDIYKIQYNLPENKTIEAYQICMEKVNNDPMYTKITMSSSFADIDYSTAWSDSDQFGMNFTKAYGSCKNQTEFISKHIGRPFHTDGKCCFALLQLLSYRNLFPGVAQRAAFSYVNTAALWSTCHGENWNEVERRVRKLAKSTPNSILVWTGVKFDERKEIAFGNRWNHPPFYLWKVIQDPGTNSSLAIIQVNVPDVNATVASSKYKLCPDICNQTEIMKGSDWTDATRGYTYCCTVEQFQEAFYFHLFEVHHDAVLTGLNPPLEVHNSNPTGNAPRISVELALRSMILICILIQLIL